MPINLPQAKQLAIVPTLTPMTVAQLNMLAASGTVTNGTQSYATDGRAITSSSLVTGTAIVQAAGQGEGVSVTYSSKASAWRITGWAVTVSA